MVAEVIVAIAKWTKKKVVAVADVVVTNRILALYLKG
jgi:hypothetical protein